MAFYEREHQALGVGQEFPGILVVDGSGKELKGRGSRLKKVDGQRRLLSKPYPSATSETKDLQSSISSSRPCLHVVSCFWAGVGLG